MSEVKLIPEYLYSDELRYELKRRGIPPGRNAEELRRQFRATGQQEMALIDFQVEDVQGEIETCMSKMEEWEGRRELWQQEVPRGRERARVLTRLEHLRGRLLYTSELPQVREADGNVWFEGALARVNELLGLLSGQGVEPGASDRPFQSEPAMDSGNAAVAGERPSEVNSLQVTDGAVLSLGGTGAVREAGAPLGVGEVFEPPRHVEVGRSPGGSSGAATVPVYSLYHKLPNPLEALLKGLPSVDGSDISHLLRFLSGVMRLLKTKSVRDGDLMLLLTPYCQGPLADRLSEVVERGGTLKDFHKDILDFFIPGRLRQQLGTERVFRLQGTNESLANFVGSVREAAWALRLPLTGSDLFQTIMEGLSPAERT